MLESRICANRSLHLCPMAPSGFDTAVRSGSGLNYLRLSIRSILVGKSGLSGSVENMLCFLGR